MIVDGVPNTAARSGGVILYVPTQDSTNGMKIMTTMFDAAYGHTNGGVVSVSGPNGQPIMLPSPSGEQIDAKTKKVLNPFFDTSAFQPLADQYTIPPNPAYATNFRGPSQWGRNAATSKDLRIWERLRLQIRAEATDFTNSVLWGNPRTNISNQATFGVISSGGGGRHIQMSARVAF